MTSTGRVSISTQARQRLQRELAVLRELLSTAVDDDNDENVAAVRRARNARIQRIHELLFDAAVDEDPPDDRVAEAGMVVTVRHDGTARTPPT